MRKSHVGGNLSRNLNLTRDYEGPDVASFLRQDDGRGGQLQSGT